MEDVNYAGITIPVFKTPPEREFSVEEVLRLRKDLIIDAREARVLIGVYRREDWTTAEVRPMQIPSSGPTEEVLADQLRKIRYAIEQANRIVAESLKSPSGSPLEEMVVGDPETAEEEREDDDVDDEVLLDEPPKSEVEVLAADLAIAAGQLATIGFNSSADRVRIAAGRLLNDTLPGRSTQDARTLRRSLDVAAEALENFGYHPPAQAVREAIRRFLTPPA